MLCTRLTRLMRLLTLTRHSLLHLLRDLRTNLALGHRARGLKQLKLYERRKADHDRLAADVRRRLGALITAD